jgi:hypothetical protein
VNDLPLPARAAQPAARDGRYIGPLRVTLPLVVVAIVLIGSVAYLGWVVTSVSDGQIPLLAAGFVALGASFAAIAVGSVVGMWRAASRAAAGRAFVLAMVGGLSGLAAIGSFTVSALSMLVWNT